MGNAVAEGDRRCAIITSTRRKIIFDLQDMFHDNNELVQLFKTSLDRMPYDGHKVVQRCRGLFHQIIVDTYAKIESKRMNFLRFKQTKLRSDGYVNLRDAINTDEIQKTETAVIVC